MGFAPRFQLHSRAARVAFGSLACAIAWAACGDGIGTPIRRAAPGERDASLSVDVPDAAVDAGAAGTSGAFGFGGSGSPPRGFPSGPFGPRGEPLPPDQFCGMISAEWPPEWAAAEERMYELIAQYRDRPEVFCQGQ